MSTPLMKSILLSTVLMASAQLSTLPRRLRRGNAAAPTENELEFASAQEKEFGRARDLEVLSFSMSVSMSVDLQQNGFLPIDFSNDLSMPSDETSTPTYEPSYFPTSVPTTAPIGTSPTAVSFWFHFVCTSF